MTLRQAITKHAHSKTGLGFRSGFGSRTESVTQKANYFLTKYIEQNRTEVRARSRGHQLTPLMTKTFIGGKLQRMNLDG